MLHERSGIRLYRRRRDDESIIPLLATLMKLYIVLILFENRIIHSEPFSSLLDAEKRAVSLANEWYRKDGIEAFGKYLLETLDEMQAYYHSDAYFDSADEAHIVIESLDASTIKF